jgi:hypothetical protein
LTAYIEDIRFWDGIFIQLKRGLIPRELLDAVNLKNMLNKIEESLRGQYVVAFKVEDWVLFYNIPVVTYLIKTEKINNVDKNFLYLKDISQNARDFEQTTQSGKSDQTSRTDKSPDVSLTHHSTPVSNPDRPNRIWVIDSTEMCDAVEGTAEEVIVTAIDLHSRHVWATAVKRQTTDTTINFLSNLFDAIGTPEALISKNITDFTSKHFQKFLTQREVKHLRQTHQSERIKVCEKTNEHILECLRLARTDNPKLRWPSLLRQVLESLNDRLNEITGCAPRFLHFGLSTGDSKIKIEEARRLATERFRAQAPRVVSKINPGGVRPLMPLP